MLNSRRLRLVGKDEGRALAITERPALVADRCARDVLHRLGEDRSGGIVGLVLKHMPRLRALGPEAHDMLAPLVDLREAGEPRSLEDLRDWRNVDRVMQAALALHVDFLVGRDMLEVPVALQAEAIAAGAADAMPCFCAPHIAAVLQSHQATYHELETVLGTQDVFNLVELINAQTVREWRAQQNQDGT